jgi:hypothetical protein
MSSASHAHGHDAHESHTFDAEPVKELASDEPRTPGWIPVLGIALFTAAAVYALTIGGDPPASQEPKAAEATAQVAQVAPPAPPTPAARPAPAAPAPPATVQKLAPEEAKQLTEKIKGARTRGVMPKINK